MKGKVKKKNDFSHTVVFYKYGNQAWTWIKKKKNSCPPPFFLLRKKKGLSFFADADYTPYRHIF